MSNNGTGALALLGETIKAPFERMRIGHEIRRNDRLTLNALNNRIAEAASRVQPDNDGFGNALFASADRELEPQDAEALLLQARRASMRSTLMKGYLGSLGRFTVGVGPTFTAEVEESVQEAVEEWWAKFKKLNQWDEELEDEIPHRTWRDGEVFNRFFVQETEGPPEGWEPSTATLSALRPRAPIDESELEPPSVPAGMTFIRLIPPEHIKDPGNSVSHGILTAANDVTVALGYLWAPGSDLLEVIPASEVQHIKINVDQDVKRGRSQLEVLLKRNKQYEDWLGYRILLNLVRSAIVLVKKIVGATATEVANIRNKYASQQNDTTQTNRNQMLKGGSTVHATGGVEYEFLSPNLQAQDAQHDGREIKLDMAVATGLPEYMFTADASNANFASTMVAESPAVREFERWQDFFEPFFREIYRRVMVNGADAGSIKGLTAEAAQTMKISIEWPDLLSRDALDNTKANQIKNVGGILSKEGWANDEGIDHEVEKDRIATEREEAVEFTAPMDTGDEE